MDKPKFIPEKWHVVTLDGGNDWDIFNDAFECVLHGSLQIPDDERLKAVTLAAAAPDLYEALFLILNAPDTDEIYRNFSIARKAMAKARGEDK